MKNAKSNLGIIALIVGAGTMGVLATAFAIVATRGPAVPTDQIEARQQALAELSERLTEVSEQLTEVSGRIKVQSVRVTGKATREGATVLLRSSEALEPGARPIIYVDGVRVNGDSDEALQGVEPDQIDRIEVLKGDAAKELYGSEARNGVIQIFTKPKGSS